MLYKTVITKGEMADTMDYVFNSPLVILDYLIEAPAMVGADDDIIDVPFTDLECIYNGDLFGYGTGNFIINMHTKGFLVDGEVMEVPGIYISHPQLLLKTLFRQFGACS